MEIADAFVVHSEKIRESSITTQELKSQIFDLVVMNCKGRCESPPIKHRIDYDNIFTILKNIIVDYESSFENIIDSYVAENVPLILELYVEKTDRLDIVSQIFKYLISIDILNNLLKYSFSKGIMLDDDNLVDSIGYQNLWIWTHIFNAVMDLTPDTHDRCSIIRHIVTTHIDRTYLGGQSILERCAVLRDWETISWICSIKIMYFKDSTVLKSTMSHTIPILFWHKTVPSNVIGSMVQAFGTKMFEPFHNIVHNYVKRYKNNCELSTMFSLILAGIPVEFAERSKILEVSEILYEICVFGLVQFEKRQKLELQDSKSFEDTVSAMTRAFNSGCISSKCSGFCDNFCSS